MASTGLVRIKRHYGESDFEWELRNLVNDAGNLRRRLTDFSVKTGDIEIFTSVAYQGLEEIEGAGMRKVEEYRKVAAEHATI